MINGALSEFAAAMAAEVYGGDTRFQGLSTDTRKVAAGQLFVALRGPRFDGHQFVGAAVAAGAAAVVVEQPIADLGVPQLIVSDAYQALGTFTRFWRQKLGTPLVAVTGSNGKTTVKNMLAAILRQDYEVLATDGNYNNEVGVPLTLARLSSDHQQAVVEVGCSRRGDIAYLASLVRPDVAVVTNAASAHLEGLGDVAGVAREKGALYEGLSDRGWAVLNVDDGQADYWRSIIRERRVVSFGFSEQADVRVENYRESAHGGGGAFQLASAHGQIDIELPLGGRHNAMNAAAAAAAALICGSTAEALAPGLATVVPEAGRQQLRTFARDIRVIDDSYNANPASLAAAIDYAATQPGSTWLAVGGMGELGEGSEQAHHDAGKYAVSAGVERIFAVGELSLPLVEGARAAGLDAAHHFGQHVQALAALIEGLEPGVTLLVKGSRSAAMERVAKGVMAHLQREGS
ncbi:MAG: UDP-N-acetylmuramoyl-tripeptide--D-alanyl-D-alanine ligase [Pseudomonadota bacterium]